jgi:hypothetical protein
MTLASQILAHRMGLPRPQTLDVVCHRDLRAPMDDGVVLLADRWVARISSPTANAPSARMSARSPPRWTRARSTGLPA